MPNKQLQSPLMPAALRPMHGDEKLHIGGHRFDDGSATVLEFWRWALGDLRANLTVGILAEWIVARLLKLPISTRPTYSEYDLRTEGGKRIEVKATSYVQGWRQKQLSTPRFRIARTFEWQDLAGYARERSFHAHWYVFCLEHCKDADDWDPLDLEQWTFYLAPCEELESLPGDPKSIGLTKVRDISDRFTARELELRGLDYIEHTSPSRRRPQLL